MPISPPSETLHSNQTGSLEPGSLLGGQLVAGVDCMTTRYQVRIMKIARSFDIYTGYLF